MSTTPDRHADTAPIRILMVDDQRIVCEAVRQMVEEDASINFRAVTAPAAFMAEALACRPTVILLDLVMPQIGGLELLAQVRGCEALRDVPVVVLSTTEDATVKHSAFVQGANDYMVKLPEPPELLARVRYHSGNYNNLLQRKAAEAALNQELEEGSRYVRSLFPPPLDERGVRTDWAFEACTRLAGDAFSYGWDDGDTFVIGLHDVCGHGVAAALHSVSVLNVLRSRSLAGVDLHDPADVLRGLNAMFDMDRHNGLFFTIWYGVYRSAYRRLAYACGGHPPAVLVDPARPHKPLQLGEGGMVVGVDPQASFATRTVDVPKGARLYIFSDGVYEVNRAGGGGQIGYAALEQQIARMAAEGTLALPALAQWIREEGGNAAFEDDFTLIEVVFD